MIKVYYLGVVEVVYNRIIFNPVDDIHRITRLFKLLSDIKD